MRALLALIVLTVPAPARAGACAQHPATSITMSPRGIELPADGGVVVGTSTIGFGGSGGSADAKNPGWRFRTDNDEYTPTMVELAPGLVAYKPPDITGEVTLAAGNLALVTVRRSRTEEKPLAAPGATRVRRSTTPPRPNFDPRISISVAMRTKPPAGAIAIVMFAVSKDGNTARSWTTVSPSDRSFTVFQTPGKCEPPIPGVQEAALGEKVAFAWVDAKGRLSKLSKPLKVGR